MPNWFSPTENSSDCADVLNTNPPFTKGTEPKWYHRIAKEPLQSMSTPHSEQGYPQLTSASPHTWNFVPSQTHCHHAFHYQPFRTPNISKQLTALPSLCYTHPTENHRTLSASLTSALLPSMDTKMLSQPFPPTTQSYTTYNPHRTEPDALSACIHTIMGWLGLEGTPRIINFQPPTHPQAGPPASRPATRPVCPEPHPTCSCKRRDLSSFADQCFLASG